MVQLSASPGSFAVIFRYCSMAFCSEASASRPFCAIRMYTLPRMRRAFTLSGSFFSMSSATAMASASRFRCRYSSVSSSAMMATVGASFSASW